MALVVEVYGGQKGLDVCQLEFSCNWRHQTTTEYNLLNITRNIPSEYVSVFYILVSYVNRRMGYITLLYSSFLAWIQCRLRYTLLISLVSFILNMFCLSYF